MSRRFSVLLLVLAAVLASRFIGMALFPFADTTEPRYAEIARLMAETGDWITPWFEPGVPFWGKPPLSFWAQAAAIKVFGLAEFWVRFPSWLATLAILWLVWRLARQLHGPQVAQWSSLVFATMALTYISAGAVMTDAFLVLGTTLALVSFYLAVLGQGGLWRWLFFLGITIGLLSKGPLALVLIGIPVVLWLLLFRCEAANLRRLPWWRGILLTILLASPWYLLAELRTPGFLDYFIMGEHVRRFLDPGWVGDLYGSAHDEPKGMIWAFWLAASFPWGAVALLAILVSWLRGRTSDLIHRTISSPSTCFLLVSALAPMLFFTLAGNILATYVLPSLPFTAILIGRWVAEFESSTLIRVRVGMVGLVPVLLTALLVALAATGWKPLKTEKELVRYYQMTKKPYDSPLFYLGDLAFSARFYSRGRALEATESDLINLRNEDAFQRLYVAVPRSWTKERVTELFPAARQVMVNRRYQLLVTEERSQDQKPVSNEWSTL